MTVEGLIFLAVSAGRAGLLCSSPISRGHWVAAGDRGSQETVVLVSFSGTGVVASIIIQPSCDETYMSHLYVLGAIQVPGFTFLLLNLFREEVRTQGMC